MKTGRLYFFGNYAKADSGNHKKFQHDATTIKVTKKELTVPNIDQYYYDVRRNDKMEVLTRLLDYYNPKLSLVFCNTKRMVDELASELQGRGYAAEGIHGDMKQVQRDRVMKISGMESRYSDCNRCRSAWN